MEMRRGEREPTGKQRRRRKEGREQGSQAGRDGREGRRDGENGKDTQQVLIQKISKRCLCMPKEKGT